jgi:peroxiredoxin
LPEEKTLNPEKGDRARNFAVPDQNNKIFELSDFKGKKVLLSFHPLAWTGVCTEQMKSLEANREAFDSLDTVAVGVNVDPVPSKKAWAENIGIKHTRLLSDFWPHGKVAKAYGLFIKEDGISKRANVIIDRNQKIALLKIYKIGDLPDIKEIIEFLKKTP